MPDSSSHGSPWSELDTPGTFQQSGSGAPASTTNWDTGITGKPATATRWPTYTEVTGKPLAFTPAPHRHPWAELDDVPPAFTPTAHGGSHAADGLDPISLEGYSLAAAALTGTVADERLSANFPRLNTTSVFTAPQVYRRDMSAQNAILVREGELDKGGITAAMRIYTRWQAGGAITSAISEVASGEVGISTGSAFRALNIKVGGAADLAGGSGIVALLNATNVPSGSPVNSYDVWAQAGALKGKGASGTVTTIGTADPHCPTCGRDFALEWESAAEAGGHLAVCMWCLLEEHQFLLGRSSKGLIGKRTSPRASFPAPRSPWHSNGDHGR